MSDLMGLGGSDFLCICFLEYFQIFLHSLTHEGICGSPVAGLWQACGSPVAVLWQACGSLQRYGGGFSRLINPV